VRTAGAGSARLRSTLQVSGGAGGAPDSSAISMLAPSMVPMMRQPFIWNFMLEVPLASVPAVEMCCDSSLAGMMVSARVTL
jgi:hypothetical protein